MLSFSGLLALSTINLRSTLQQPLCTACCPPAAALFCSDVCRTVVVDPVPFYTQCMTHNLRLKKKA